MQTNLWRMTPEIAEVLAEYHVPIGSSIDGPEEITDSQRGDGYFGKTMKGYEIAIAGGLQVRFICTFTNKSVKHREEIFNFFKEKGFRPETSPGPAIAPLGEPEGMGAGAGRLRRTSRLSSR